jgi:tRNA(fMet)-specific endonuclease VapC
VTRYMLDTNMCIHLIKRRTDSLYARMSPLSVGDVTVSSIVAAELWYGVMLSQKKRQNEAALKDFFEYVEVLDWPKGAGPTYGQIRTHLKVKGTPIGAMDLLVAAHALFVGAVLVTDNTSEFERVGGLKLENWLER